MYVFVRCRVLCLFVAFLYIIAKDGSWLLHLSLVVCSCTDVACDKTSSAPNQGSLYNQSGFKALSLTAITLNQYNPKRLRSVCGCKETRITLVGSQFKELLLWTSSIADVQHRWDHFSMKHTSVAFQSDNDIICVST